MSSTKEKIAIGLSASVLVGGAMTFFQPPSSQSPEEQRQHQAQRDLDGFNEGQEQDRARRRIEAENHVGAENQRALTPGEYRSPEAPRLRLRIVP